MPAGWDKTRRAVLHASDVCYLCGTAGADEVDHVVARSRGGLEGTNLRPVHRACHSKKSSFEGVSRRRELSKRRRRPSGRHPGAL
jgi:5-methylcytosine-specific restriction endonuclease McrA